MASTNNLLEMLENPDVKMLVAEIIAVVAKSQERGVTANVACDALQYVNALICEASQFNEGPKGLRDAHKQISSDVKSMLSFVRDASLRQGEPLLFTMTMRPTIN